MTTLSLSGAEGTTRARTSGRIVAGRGVLLSDATHSLILPHITAIAEEFSRRMRIVSSLPLMDLSKAMHQELWGRAASRAEGTWDGHIDAWRKWHGVRLRDCPDFEHFDGFITARNAIMHGLGQLTRLQTQKDGGAEAIAKLMNVGIGLNGLKLVIVPSVLAGCASTARGFIEWLDLEVASRGLVASGATA